MKDFGFYNLDCMKGMKEFPDKFFDIAVVDPPYFSGPEKREYYGRKVSPIGVQRTYNLLKRGKCQEKNISWNWKGCQYTRLSGDAIILIGDFHPGESYGTNVTGTAVFRIARLLPVVYMIL